MNYLLEKTPTTTILLSILLLLISPKSTTGQTESPDRWRTVDRFVGSLTFQVNMGPEAPVGGLPGTTNITVTYDVILDREDDRTWRGKATGQFIYDAQAERIGDKGSHAISTTGQGVLNDNAYLRIDFRNGEYTFAIRGRPGPVELHHVEKMVVGSATLIDIDKKFETPLSNIGTRSGNFKYPRLPATGMVLAETLESKGPAPWEAHKLTFSLQPDGYTPLIAQQEEDFSCISLSSLVFCQAQAVVIEEPIPGTSFYLVYRSDRFDGGCNESTWDVRTMHLGGWTISSHHFFDTEKRVLHLGSGIKRNIPKGDDINSPFPGYLIVSEDGGQVFQFDESGRHLLTMHSLTGGTLLTFHYNQERLVRIEDYDRYSVTVERATNGEPSTILAPFGQITRLLLDQNGFVRNILKHGGESIRFIYDEKGLLTSRWDARGNSSSYQYNDCGRLVRATDAAGGYRTLNRQDVTGGYKVTEITASGKKSEYIVENQSGGETKWINILPGKIENTMSYNNSDYRVLNFHDGTKVEVFKTPDTRFGMQAPLKKTVVTHPDGTKQVTEVDRIALLSNPNNPFSLINHTELITINGKTYTEVFDANSRTLVRTSPSGRQTVLMLDEIGKIVSIQEPNLAPVTFKYDRGQLVEVFQGSGQNARKVNMKYHREGWLESVTDPLMQVTSFEYDLAGKVKKIVSPSADQTLFDYDESGNIEGITPPGKTKHSFEHTPVNLLGRYTPPSLQDGSHSTANTFNTDRQLTGVNLAGEGLVNIGYDAAGRLGNIRFSPGTINYSYDRQGRLEKVTFPGGAIEHRYSGVLNETEIWTGLVAGNVNYQYNNDFKLKSITVNNTQPVQFKYDDDGLLTQAGNLEIQRNEHSGFVERTNLGRVSDERHYNEFGELDSYAATFGGQVLFETQYQRDALGRIVKMTEKILGDSKTRSFDYDSNGRLEKEFENGQLIAQYHYDSNGNRTSLTTPEVITNSSHDAQDRLISSGNAAYSYNNFGQLNGMNKGQETIRYNYDELGNLRKVTKPGVGTIEYLSDGHNRKIGTKVNGDLVSGLIYKDELNPVAQFDAKGNLQSVFVYGTEQYVPNYIVKGGRTFRLITDHLGSVRLVVDIESGKVEQRIDFDAFGVVIEDTNPGFQPFGFTGGIYDNLTGLVRFGARDYDPHTGRWTSKDPILFDGGETNLYSYAGNDPVNWIDVYGLSASPPTLSPNGTGIWTVKQARSLIYSESRRFSRSITDLQYGETVEEIDTCEETPGWIRVRYVREHSGETFEGYMPVHDFMPRNVLQPGQAPGRQGTGRGGSIGSAARG